MTTRLSTESGTIAPWRRHIYYSDCTTEGLRRAAKRTGPGKWERYTREMLLAFWRNRYPVGYFMIEGNGKSDMEED